MYLHHCVHVKNKEINEIESSLIEVMNMKQACKEFHELSQDLIAEEMKTMC